MCCVIMCDAIWTKCSTALTPAVSSMRSPFEKPKMFNSLKWITTAWAETCGSQKKNNRKEFLSVVRLPCCACCCLAVAIAIIHSIYENHFSSRTCANRAANHMASHTHTRYGNIHFEKLHFHLTAEENIYAISMLE